MRCKKAGHTGTLDPLAAGVLPICIGRATKIAGHILEQDKIYICEATLGKQTDTDDSAGRIISSVNNVHTSKEEIENILNTFKGDSKQIPPIYSAIRHKGKRLYELARKGEKVVPKARSIKIYNIELLAFYRDYKVLFKAHCSKGTYMRSLCRDMGQHLGYGAYMSFLLRTQTGAFNIENSITLHELQYYVKMNKVNEILHSMDFALADLDYIIIDPSQYNPIIHGRFIELEHIEYISRPSREMIDNKKLMRMYCKEDFMGLGLFEQRNGRNILRIKKLLI